MPKFDATQWENQIFSTKDILKEIPVTHYLVKSAIVLPSLNLFYGIPGSMKTLLLMDLAVCVALGKNWLQSHDDFPGFEVEQAPVLWIDYDSGKDILHERFSALLKEHARNTAHAEQAPIYFMSFANPVFTASNDAAVNAIVAMAIKLGAKLIVFDNLGTISGGADENSYEMVVVMNNLRYIAEKAQAAVEPIHHIAKKDNGKTRHTPRGHSSIEAAIDLALLIERDSDALVVTPTKNRRATFDPFMALFEYEHYAHTETLKRANFAGAESAPDPISLKVQDALAKHFKSNSVRANQSKLLEVCKDIKVGRPRALSEFHRLVRKNFMKVEPNREHNQTIYQWIKK